MSKLLTFLEEHPKGHFMQAPFWAEVKREWDNETITVLDENDNIKGSMQLLIRKVPFFPYRIIYSPRAPVCDIHDKETLAALTEKVKEVAKNCKAYTFKIDPDVKVSETEFVDYMKSLGYKQRNSKNFEGVQPNFVFRLNVENKTEEEIFANFHKKWRYNTNLSARKGVTVELGERSDLKRFHEIMQETGLRDKFVIRSQEYFERMYDCLGKNMRLYLAKFDGEIIAGTIAIHFGDKVWYLYGASSNSSRNVMPNYLLQWEMIKWSLELKCRIYDFRGVSGDLSEDNPLYGLYRFKKGFGGDLTEFVGELELTFKPFTAKVIETSMKLYTHLRKVLFLIRK